jgi:hypothetical protein
LDVVTKVGPCDGIRALERKGQVPQPTASSLLSLFISQSLPVSLCVFLFSLYLSICHLSIYLSACYVGTQKWGSHLQTRSQSSPGNPSLKPWSWIPSLYALSDWRLLFSSPQSQAFFFAEPKLTNTLCLCHWGVNLVFLCLLGYSSHCHNPSQHRSSLLNETSCVC